MVMSYPPAPRNEEPDPGVIVAAVATMHTLTFVWLISLGYDAQHAVAVTAALAAGLLAVLDRLHGNGGPREPR